MPASIPVTPHEKQWLKKLIEEQCLISITDSFSCKQLSALLKKKHSVAISYNTIRRLFNIVPAADRASLFTLNTIVQAIGFTSFDTFKIYITAFDFAAFNEMLMLSLLNKKADHKKILDGISMLAITNWEEAYLIKSIVDLCIQLDDYTLLKKIINTPFRIEEIGVQQRIFISFQQLYIETANGNKKMNAFVLKHIPGSILLQKILLQTYVLEQMLTGFWGKWLSAADTTLIEDMPVFKNILLCQKAFMQSDMATAKAHLVKTKSALRNKNIFIHPILLGRIAAWEMLLNKNKKALVNYYHPLGSEFDKAYFLVFYCRLIWTFADATTAVDLIESVDTSKFHLITNVFENQIMSKFFITLAAQFHLKLQTAEVKKALIRVNENRLDTFKDTNWYRSKYFQLKNEYCN